MITYCRVGLKWKGEIENIETLVAALKIAYPQMFVSVQENHVVVCSIEENRYESNIDEVPEFRTVYRLFDR